ncbi:MAG: ATP-binding cassette domain-containing protein [Paludibacter sp.]|nr:ATP-binding cassette domain-containing protein [Paludibacter sp.]
MSEKIKTIGNTIKKSPLGDLGACSTLKISIQKSMLTSDGKADLMIDTEICGKEFLCIFGHSGAGKTTLLRILAGLTKPDKGRISYGDQVWFDSELKINLSPQERNIGFMFQDYALFPHMSVEKNIAFGQKVKNEEELNALIKLFDLESLKKQKPFKLSGGQKQRVALARALASKPKVLMLDEPLSALDVEKRVELQEEILKVHELLNTVTLMVSHNISEVERLASSVIVLKNGAIMQTGKPEDIFKKRTTQLYAYKNSLAI